MQGGNEYAQQKHYVEKAEQFIQKLDGIKSKEAGQWICLLFLSLGSQLILKSTKIRNVINIRKVDCRSENKN